MTVTSMPTRRKEILITLLVLVAVAASFWMGSRYPDLDRKALMGGEIQLAAIGFDVIVEVPPDASVGHKMLANTLNWMYTNWKGMVFGLLLGAIVLSLLPLLRRVEMQSPLANSIAGMFIGAPLGVCVNCATPIAQGVFASGARTETGLAALVSSPTLNVIVLSLVVALFPFYMVATKIGLTLLFILLVIPLLTRYAGFPRFATEGLDRATQQGFPGFSNAVVAARDGRSDTWLAAVGNVLIRLLKNLWYILRITLPLMLLAGALGAILVTLLPLEALADMLPTGNGVRMLAAMVLLAVIGVFLPVPMTFDVIVTAVLMQAGLPMGYAMVLLFTLGIFSVYPFMLIWSRLSRWGAVAIYLSVMVLGVLGGVLAQEIDQWDQARQQRLLVERFSRAERPTRVPPVDRAKQGQEQQVLIGELAAGALARTPVLERDGIRVERIPFAPRSVPSGRGADGGAAPLFSRVPGADLGITEHANFSVQRLAQRLANSRGVASGDVHNDGWPDLVFASDAGIGLYANLQGRGYRRQRLAIPELGAWFVGTVALVDLDDDGWLDLFIGTYGDGSHVIYNDRGRFDPAGRKSLPNHAGAIQANAPAFGDIDRDGRLDIVLGNATVGNNRAGQSPEGARNVRLRQRADGFEVNALPAIRGETLTTLLVDLNGDQWLDLLVGNEFRRPDAFYLNSGSGDLKLVGRDAQLIPYSGATTMSFASADIDNDLVPEVFVGQKAWKRGDPKPVPAEQLCTEIVYEHDRRDCIAMQSFFQRVRAARFPGSVMDCLEAEAEWEQQGCLAIKLLGDADRERDPEHCETLARAWPRLAAICRGVVEPVEPPVPERLADAIPSVKKRNVLLVRNAAGTYDDHAAKLGLSHAGWVWNAKFADLDNDEWQDLFAVTGDLTARLRHPSAFFRNLQGQTFENRTEEAGLLSRLDTLAYTYTDMDNDGDLDIVAVPAVGPVTLYRNNGQSGQSIAFELRDHQGNRFGIGSRITIHYGNGKHQMRDIQASGGFLSFDAPVAYFGLGNHTGVERVEIQWSTGESSRVTQPLMAGARYLIERSGP